MADGSMKTCPDCFGDGETHCEECEDEGVIECQCFDCGDRHDRDCPDCDGGDMLGTPCESCSGKGRIPKTDRDLEAEGQLNLLQMEEA